METQSFILNAKLSADDACDFVGIELERAIAILDDMLPRCENDAVVFLLKEIVERADKLFHHFITADAEEKKKAAADKEGA